MFLRAYDTSVPVIRKRWPWVKHFFADGAYDRLKLIDKASYLDFFVQVVGRSDGQKGQKVLPRRWSSNEHWDG